MTREKMTREELIKEIAKRAKDIRKLYYSVYPEGEYLTIAFDKDFIDFNNKYYKEDKDYPIVYFENYKPYVRINKKQEDK